MADAGEAINYTVGTAAQATIDGTTAVLMAPVHGAQVAGQVIGDGLGLNDDILSEKTNSENNKPKGQPLNLNALNKLEQKNKPHQKPKHVTQMLLDKSIKGKTRMVKRKKDPLNPFCEEYELVPEFYDPMVAENLEKVAKQAEEMKRKEEETRLEREKVLFPPSPEKDSFEKQFEPVQKVTHADIGQKTKKNLFSDTSSHNTEGAQFENPFVTSSQIRDARDHNSNNDEHNDLRNSYKSGSATSNFGTKKSEGQLSEKNKSSTAGAVPKQNENVFNRTRAPLTQAERDNGNNENGVLDYFGLG